MPPALKILVYGYGNPGRQDDGLGVEFVKRFQEWVIKEKLEGFEFENNYQLNIEDAEIIADKDIVIFADATVEHIEDFCISDVISSFEVSFTTHSASPGYILHLCKELFGSQPNTLLLHIRGYSWDIGEGLTPEAGNNLEKALAFFREKFHPPGSLLKPGTAGSKSC